jgi:hypothetical protein
VVPGHVAQVLFVQKLLQLVVEEPEELVPMEELLMFLFRLEVEEEVLVQL